MSITVRKECGMARRDRIYASNAEKQKAYRERKKAEKALQNGHSVTDKGKGGRHG